MAIGYYAGAGRGWEHAALLLRAHHVMLVAVLSTLAVAYAFVSLRARPPKGGG